MDDCEAASPSRGLRGEVGPDELVLSLSIFRAPGTAGRTGAECLCASVSGFGLGDGPTVAGERWNELNGGKGDRASCTGDTAPSSKGTGRGADAGAGALGLGSEAWGWTAGERWVDTLDVLLSK